MLLLITSCQIISLFLFLRTNLFLNKYCTVFVGFFVFGLTESPGLEYEIVSSRFLVFCPQLFSRLVMQLAPTMKAISGLAWTSFWNFKFHGVKVGLILMVWRAVLRCWRTPPPLTVAPTPAVAPPHHQPPVHPPWLAAGEANRSPVVWEQFALRAPKLMYFFTLILISGI